MCSAPWQGLALPRRGAVIGAVVAGAVGGVVGLIVGLLAYPPTAWFAVFELGVPAAVLGGLVGLAAGGLAAFAKQRAGRSESAGRNN